MSFARGGGRITLDPGTPEECELLPLGDGIVLNPPCQYA